MAVTIDQARAVMSVLPRSYEALVRDRVKFRVGRIVYAAFSRDDTIMGFAFPREQRDALVAAEPDKFLLPRASDMRYQWVCVRLAAIDADELRECCSTRGGCASRKASLAPMRNSERRHACLGRLPGQRETLGPTG